MSSCPEPSLWSPSFLPLVAALSSSSSGQYMSTVPPLHCSDHLGLASLPLSLKSSSPWCDRMYLTVRCVFLSLSLKETPPTFCPYSSRTSRCWCTLDHIDEEHRISHSAYLCVTNIAGSVTSNVLHFTPMSISKSTYLRSGVRSKGPVCEV